MSDLPSTIRNPAGFLRSPAAGFDGVFDWAWTQGCFGETRITPMDFDGVVERHGQLLIFETKDIGVPVKQGQLITLRAAHAKGGTTVMIIHGKRGPERSHCWYPDSRLTADLTGEDEARAFVARWYRWADRRPA